MSADEQDEACRQLLQTLKGTAEGLLAGHSTNVWSVYGGLQRLHSAVLKILQHGLRIHDPHGIPDPWAFVEALQWLQPSLASSPPFRPSLLKTAMTSCADDDSSKNESRRNEQYSEWLFKSLESHSLSAKLSWLLSDRSHLESCYEPFAYLRRPKHSEAALICLRAVEQGQPSLLNDLDPRLYLSQLSTKQFVRSHRRCSSFPDNVRPFMRLTRRSTTLPHLKLLPTTKLTLERQWSSEPSLFNTPKPKTRDRSSTTSDVNRKKKFNVEAALQELKLVCQAKERRHSSPRKETLRRPTNLSLSTTIQEDTPKSVEKTASVDVLVEPCTEALSQEIPISPPANSAEEGSLSPSKLATPGSSLSMSPQFMSPFVVTAFGSMDRKPSDVTGFLASAGKFSDPAEELGRENAHFSVSEAMIAAIERAKCERNEKNAKRKLRKESITDDTLNSEEEDDVEIARLQEKIRARRREKELREKRLISRTRRVTRARKQLNTNPLTSDGRTDTPNTDQSSVTPPSSPSSDSEEDNSQDHLIDSDQPGAPCDNLARVGVSGLSMSLASLYSESELASRQPNCILEESVQSHKSTAEGVAFALLSQFKGKVIPNESELQWLVSEKEVPQKLLPLPSSWPVSPDDAEDEDMTRATQLRGNFQWAPPRAQIIFTPHPSPNKKILLGKQNYMCAGCGMKVEPQYANKMRYCEYLGRFFCTGCHGNQLAMIPGRIITKWDFSRFPVSAFSYRLLDQMQNDALFRLEDLNPNLFRKFRQLAKCKLVRVQLAELSSFISHCRFASIERTKLSREPSHLPKDPDLYSMVDLCQVKTGELVTRLQHLVNLCQEHVANCSLCPARGFICEICRNSEILYPWDVAKVVRCRHCGCCLHAKCWHNRHSPPTSAASPQDCPRCFRIREREQQKLLEA
ncbi:run domain Beclin-1-interacting and cysteine-rich domain-containing protein [Neocloeon triangulifer]|uniref:run domain Beclin-1-interacting and cysteine-rich domain-containing protein n=1 Tax=Neocloeon triangulifer TaxID=2078957 RepID=UPI00286ED191|nr:run domain Beclin-1-interacting and cysteine-rich domain-containing protein [Neocloeon triangulifer]